MQCTIGNNKSAFLSAILLLQFHGSRKLISIASRSRPLAASRPVSHVSKTQYLQAVITWRKELYYFAFLCSITSNCLAGSNHDNINKAQFYAPSMYKAWISVWKERPKETTVQSKLSIQVYKNDRVFVNDRLIWFHGKYRSEVLWRNNLSLVALKIWVSNLHGYFFNRPLGLHWLVCPAY